MRPLRAVLSLLALLGAAPNLPAQERSTWSSRLALGPYAPNEGAIGFTAPGSPNFDLSAPSVPRTWQLTPRRGTSYRLTVERRIGGGLALDGGIEYTPVVFRRIERGVGQEHTWRGTAFFLGPSFHFRVSNWVAPYFGIAGTFAPDRTLEFTAASGADRYIVRQTASWEAKIGMDVPGCLDKDTICLNAEVVYRDLRPRIAGIETRAWDSTPWSLTIGIRYRH
jgi:hypothetical protein